MVKMDTSPILSGIHTITNDIMLNFNGSFTLANSDSDTDTNSMKFYCQWVLVSVDNSKQFYVSHLLLSLCVGLCLGQCKHTIMVVITDKG